MKVLFISHDGAKTGGASLALLDLLDSIEKYNDIEPIVMVPNDRAGLTDELTKRDIQYIVYPYWNWAYDRGRNELKNIYRYIKVLIRQIQSLISINQLIKKVKAYNIDIIHSNSSVVSIGGYINLFTNIPHVWHVREFGEEHHNFRFILGMSLTRKAMSKMSNKIITISDILNRKYLKYVEKSKLIRIYDGVSQKYCNPKIESKSEGKYNILITGSVQPGKGQIRAIEAVSMLINIGYNIKLTIAGEYSENEYFKLVKNKILSYGISDNVEIIGHVKDLNIIRQNMDLELVCSFMEGFGRVTVEGMLSMLPIIASNSGANSELVIDSVNGYLYEVGNTEDLQNKIKILYNDRSLGIKLGKEGYNIAKENFLQDK